MSEHGVAIPILVLVAPFFDGDFVPRCVSTLRARGHATTLVSLIGEIVESSHGVTLLVDNSLTRLPPPRGPVLVVIPGGPACARALLQDPRVHRLAEEAVAAGGYLAVAAAAEETATPLLAQDVRKDDHYCTQSADDNRSFIERLGWMAAGVSSTNARRGRKIKPS